MSTLSVCLIVKNEEKNIPAFIRGVQGIADEIIVVDTGSSDRTCRIAKKHPKVKLSYFNWINDFSAARNSSLDAATKDWILVLDADERLEDPAAIRALIDAEDVDAYHVQVRNFQPPGSLTKYEDSYLLRLFRNRDEYRFEGRIHEQVSPSIRRADGNIKLVQERILHHGYTDDTVQGKDSRRRRNLGLLQAQLDENPDDFYYLYHMGLALKVVDIEKSRAFFELALEKGGPEMVEHIAEQCHMRLAQLALERHDNAEAIQQAKKSLEINPVNMISRVCLITAYVSVRGFIQALPHLQIVVAQGLDKVPNPDDFQKLLQFCTQQAQV